MSGLSTLTCTGREYDKNGNRIQWWKNDSITQFNERVQCLVEQYNQYIFQGYQVRKMIDTVDFVYIIFMVHHLFQNKTWIQKQKST